MRQGGIVHIFRMIIHFLYDLINEIITEKFRGFSFLLSLMFFKNVCDTKVGYAEQRSIGLLTNFQTKFNSEVELISAASENQLENCWKVQWHSIYFKAVKVSDDVHFNVDFTENEWILFRCQIFTWNSCNLDLWQGWI